MTTKTIVTTVIDNEVNVDAMLAVADVIEYSDRFNLNHVVLRTDSNYDKPWDQAALWDDCGTVGCVWGWTCAWADISVYDGLSERPAAEELGLTGNQSRRLFFGERDSVWANLADEYGWDLEWCVNGAEEMVSAVGLADWTQVTATQAAEVLRRIAANEVDL